MRLSQKDRLADLLRLGSVCAVVVVALDFFDHLVDGLGLLLPLALAHLKFLLKELIVGLPVASSKAVPESCVLSIVVVEVQVVHGVTGGTVDDGRVVRVLAVVDQDSPDVDEDEEEDVCELGQRENEGEDVIRKTLSVAVGGVERVRGERSRHDPLVVWLVDVLVDTGMVQTTVDPVDGRVGEEEEEGKLKVVVPESRALIHCVV